MKRTRFLLCLLSVLGVARLSSLQVRAQVAPRTLIRQPYTFDYEAGALAFAPGTPLGDKGVLAIAQSDGSIELWNPREETKIRSLSGLKLMPSRFAFTPDGKRLAAMALVRDGKRHWIGTQFGVWDITMGALLSTFSGPNRGINTMAFRNGGAVLAVSGAQVDQPKDDPSYESAQAVVQLYDVTTGKQTGSFKTFVGVFAPNGTTIARFLEPVMTVPDKPAQARAIIWDSTGAESVPPTAPGTPAFDAKGVWTQGGEDYGIGGGAFSPDGRVLATSGNDDIKLWDAATGALKLSLDGVSGRWLMFSKDGTRLAAMGFTSVTILDAHNGDLLARMPITPMSDPKSADKLSSGSVGVLSPSGKLLAYAVPTSESERAIVLFDLSSVANFGQPAPRDPADPANVRTSHTPISLTDIAWSSDGRQLLVGGDSTLNLWRASDGARLRSASGGVGVESVAWSKDGKLILTGGRDIRLWTSTTLMPRVIGQHEWGINTVALSPDGKLAAAGGTGLTGSTGKASLGQITLWDTVTGKRLKLLTNPSNRVNTLLFSADGKWLIDGCYDGGMDVWNVAEALANPDQYGGKPQQRIGGSDEDGPMRSYAGGGYRAVTKLAWHADLIYAAQTDGTINVYHWQDGGLLAPKSIRTLQVGDGMQQVALLAFALSPDGKTLAVGHEAKYLGPGSVELRDTTTGKVLQTLALPRRPRAVAFAPDGQTLAVTVQDGTLKLWQLNGKK